MKIDIESYLKQIDNAFNEKTKKDIYMIYIMIFGAIFAFSYLLYWESSELSFNQMKDRITKINQKINQDNSYLKNNPEAKIARLDADIKLAKIQLIEYKDNNSFIRAKIEAISSLIYDEPTWGEYLHSISKNAKKNNIKLITFTNKFIQNKKSFGHVLDISIKTTGKYINTLNFINSLEQSPLVVDIHSLSIKAEDSLNTDLNISVWGITY